MARFERSETREELRSGLARFLNLDVECLDPVEMLSQCKASWGEDSWDGASLLCEGSGGLLCLVARRGQAGPDHECIFGGARIRSGEPLGSMVWQVVDAYTQVFNLDVKSCSDEPKTFDLWRALQRTRPTRTIARLFSSQPPRLAKLVEHHEASLNLTYEGRSVRHTVLVVGDDSECLRRQGRQCYPVDDKTSLEQLLFVEKWIRPVVDGRTLLLAADHNGNVRGIYEPIPSVPSGLGLMPHRTLGSRLALLDSWSADSRPQDIAMIAGDHGELFIVSGTLMTENQDPSRFVFQKRQGTWTYQDYRTVLSVVSGAVRKFCGNSAALPRCVVLPLLQNCLDLSYERQGGLFVLIKHDAGADLSNLGLVLRSGGANEKLTKAFRGVKLGQRDEAIKRAAAADGAVIFNHTGEVLQVGAMVDISQVKSAAGARSTAARAASKHGVAIKISDDGPIEAFYNEELLFKFN